MIIDVFNRTLKYARFSPLLLLYLLKKRKLPLVEEDLDMALNVCPWHASKSRSKSFLNYVSFLPEWRVLYLYRLGVLGKFLSIFYPNKMLLWIVPKMGVQGLGGGFFPQHCYASRIEPKTMGRNCQVWQNVTIGKKTSGGGSPVIGNNVKICAGALVLGDIKIGDNVVIGANAVVLQDVPNNCIAVGVPARIISKNTPS